MKPVDRLIAGYLVFASVMAVARGGWNLTVAMILVAHLLMWVLLYLFTRMGESERVGPVLHTLYPLLFLLPLYTEIGFVNTLSGVGDVLQHDLVVQSWEAALFGGQPSYDLIRNYPSVFFSGLLHLAYFSYYPIIMGGPPIMLLKRDPEGARRIILASMTAFVICFTIFYLYPVAGPNYAFDNPTGPVREVWPARWVYAALEGGSAVGTAFPSSHVAATSAATIGAWCAWKRLGQAFLIPCVLLILGTVYAQMHYAIDALAGLVAGIGAGALACKLRP